MTQDKASPGYGRHAFGAGIIAIGLLGLVLGTFHPGQPVPKDFPGRAVLAYVVAALLVIAGAGLQWRRTVRWAAGGLAAYYWLAVVLLMDGRLIFRNWREYLAYSNTAEQVAIAAAALIVFVSAAPLDPILARRLTRVGQVAFGVCAVLFGGAHFFYMNLTAPLVPKWLPPSQLFWGYATGVFHIAGGLAIISGIRARLGAILLTVMYAAFTPLALLPLLLSKPDQVGPWAENAVNLALIGAAWVVADSLRKSER
ncbi:MAG: DoxX family membrane protein [Proteobacteria bacterium]|nr:DoxX family membrane protein [Pseudomonadota bacterium]